LATAQPNATFNNSGSITTPVDVNATNFINSGTWDINTPGFPSLPFQTFSTYNYTNSGTMSCSIGWQFDHGPWPSGARDWSANFFNDNTGTIAARDAAFTFSVSKLLISATNIINKGLLSAGPYGKMLLVGSGVNLSRSGLEITPLVSIPNGNGATNFSPDIAIYDEYWRGGTNAQTFVGSPWSGNIIFQAILGGIGSTCGGSNGVVGIGPLVPQAYDSYTNVYGRFQLITTNKNLTSFMTNMVYSNLLHQAVFASVSDANIIPSVRFGPSLGVSNIFLPMVAQLLTYSTNIVTGSLQASTIYVVDNLAAVGTNGYLLQSTYFDPGAVCQQPTYRPDSVTVSRQDDGTYASGKNYYGKPSGTFFYNPVNFSNLVANGRADAYSAQVDNLASQPPAGFSVTNAPGRIEIYARDLNLSKTRMTAAAAILISATNLVSSSGAAIDCQNLSYDLGATNGLLNITNLAFTSVRRLNGTVTEWSGIWTNYQVDIYTNYIPDPADTNVPPINSIRSDITNVVEVDLAITVVDANGLTPVVPVTVLNLILHSTNMVVSDNMTVSRNLLFDGQSLTIQGGITLTDPLLGWSMANAPTLRFFTNNGDLQIPQAANFGGDGPANYAVFVNNGTLNAGSETINSDIFLAGGSQTAAGGFFLTTLSGKVENGSISSGQAVDFSAGTLKLNKASITAGDQLYFHVTGSLFDAGGSSGNVLLCNNGFDLAIKPATGDLLGTALETITPEFAAVDHYWSALDRGNSSAGYTNNVAVGKLALNEGFDTEFVFHATGSSNAIYVDLLDLSQCPGFLDPDVLTIDPNFVIYYAAAKLPSSFTIPPNTNGLPQQAEEFLNGQLGGHLVWVSSFAGPNSSVDVLINGQTAQVNKALRYSKIIDSNGNGIPNYYDLNPFDLPVLALSAAIVPNNPPPTKKLAISWTATPGTVYLVQFSTDYSPASWSPLMNYTNTAPTNLVVTVWDTNVLSGQRFYRVSHP